MPQVPGAFFVFEPMEIRNIAITPVGKCEALPTGQVAHVDHPSTTSSLCSDGYGARLIVCQSPKYL